MNKIDFKEAYGESEARAAGVVMGGLLHISGQLPLDPSTGKLVEGGVREQMLQALGGVQRVLLAAGTTKENIGLCRVYLSDSSDVDEAEAAYTEFFGSQRPARVLIPAKELPCGALAEVEAVAEMPTYYAS